MTEEDWKDIWEQFEHDCDFEVDAEFQDEMEAKHGAGFYIISPEESWSRQQKLIQKIVEAKLKEKNT
jgi:hypothetical protein